MDRRDISPKPCIVSKLGLVPYHEAYRLQKYIRNKRIEGEVPDTILLLEHPPTFTIGKSGSIENILISQKHLSKKELAAIGLSLEKWVTMHGFALNVNPNLGHFSFINPCDFSDRRATSISNILAHEVLVRLVIHWLVVHFSQILDVSLKIGPIA